VKTRLILLVGAIVSFSAFALAQNSTTYEQTTHSDTGTTTTTTTFRGPIVRFEPGHVIVLHQGDRDVTYTLSPSAEVPSDVAVGRVVTITTEPGSNTVSRIVTNDTDSMGRPRQTTETREVDAQGNMTTTKETTVFGTVESYEAGKSLTITDKHGKKVTYLVTDSSQLPTTIKIGKKVRIYTIPAATGSQPVVKRVTVTTETNSPYDQ
jgi:hypothetical protein